MSMILAILIAVLLDNFAAQLPGAKVLLKLRSYKWVETYFDKVSNFLTKYVGDKKGYLQAFLLFVPMLVAVLLAQFLFWLIFGIIGYLLVETVALFYFLGGQEPAESDMPFVSEHEHSYAILFWFALLGPIGALIYWFLIITKKYPARFSGMEKVHAIVAWVPARITGFLYALVGRFNSGFGVWFNCIKNVAMPSSEFLQTCGQASSDASNTEDAKNLVKRGLIAWVVLSILIVAYK